MKTPPRFALDAAPGPDGIARITGAEAHHMRDVARIAPSDTVTLIDASGAEYSARLERYGHAVAELRILALHAAKSRPELIIAPAIIKGPRMDFLTEKAAELGATSLWPVVCARGLVRAPGAERIARWNRLAIAAAKQSMAVPPMRVHEAIDFAGLVSAARRDPTFGGIRLICTPGAEPAGAILERERPRAILIACGPEGDFDADERALASQAGFIAAGLGPNRLRSETAVIAAIAIAAQWLASGV